MDEARITVDDRHGVTVVALVGEHDLSTALEVSDAFAALTDGLVIDLSRTTFLDSSILGAVLGAARDAEQRKMPFTVVIPDDPGSAARRIFDLTGLMTTLPVASDVAGAVEARQDGSSA
jgi:anti-anti-sigma factor